MMIIYPWLKVHIDFLAINKSINDIYTCVLTCQCSTRFKLSFMSGGFFELSSFYRHIKEKQCIQLPNEVSISQVKIIFL